MEKKKARIRIAPGTYRNRQGFNISGTDLRGRSVRIFTESRASAEHIRERIRDGHAICVEDFRDPACRCRTGPEWSGAARPDDSGWDCDDCGRFIPSEAQS
jgi:hypothetical protein